MKKITNEKNAATWFFRCFVISGTLSLCLLAEAGLAREAQLKQLLKQKSAAMITAIVEDNVDNGATAFSRFSDEVCQELRKLGDFETAEKLAGALSKKNNDVIPVEAIAWLAHAFAHGYYKEQIIGATSDLIGFRTFATGVPNRQNPEFLKQETYLRNLAGRLGLNYRNVDGYVQEISIGEAPASFAIMVHSDVQPVEEDTWSVDPWAGEIKAGKLWGRGAIDDKGPLATIMYAMRTLLDTGLPLQTKIVLLVGTDEESANEDVTTYLKTNPAPDQTIVVDSNYPVYCAEKGWCGTWLRTPRKQREVAGEGFIIEDLQGGYSPSVIPGDASAKVRAPGMAQSEAKAKLSSLIGEFKSDHSEANIELSAEGDLFILKALGREVHSSLPETGHNALMDLVVFLDQYLKPVQNDIALMAKFAATYIGMDIYGVELGIQYNDDFMGPVTATGDIFSTQPDSILFMFNYRIPKGIGLAKLKKEIFERIHRFSSDYDIPLKPTNIFYDAHFTDPNSPFVQRLLSIYGDVAGAEYKARSLPGGTYASRLPNAVVYGPAMPDEEYMGHRPDEFLSLQTLEHNIDVLTNTIARFALQQPGNP